MKVSNEATGFNLKFKSKKKKLSKPNENEKSESTRTTLVINSKNHSKLTD